MKPNDELPSVKSRISGGAVLRLIVTSILGAVVAAPALPSAEEAEGVRLEVMTFNIRYGTADDGENHWESRRRLVFDVIRRRAPDVIGLQEALKFQIDEILEAVPRYKMVGVGRDDGRTEGEYSAILYLSDRLRLDDQGTFWFSDTPEVPASTSWGNTIPRICTWARFLESKSGQGFYVYNVHLDHRSQRSRLESVRLLTRRVAARRHLDPPLVTGDFNADEKNPAIEHLKGFRPAERTARETTTNLPGMVDTFRSGNESAAEVGTFNGFRGRTDGEKIDFVFAPSWVKIEGAEILRDNDGGRYPSDHFPVVATVRLPRVILED